MMDKKLVEAVVERLGSQAAVSAGAVEAVLDTLTQMGLLNDPLASSSSLLNDPAFNMTFRNYLSLSATERRALVIEAQERRRDWLRFQLEARQAAWILVIGGQVVKSSQRLDDYPTPERLMKLGTEHDRIPFVFTRPPLFEEIPWSALPGDDFYPTLALTIGAGDWEDAQMPAQGHYLNADFDTGSPYLFLSWDWLLSLGLVTATPVDFPQTWHHLGRQYVYYTRLLRVGVADESGTIRSLPVACECVEDWQESPLCEVNSTRQALAGRNLLLGFPLTLKLDGAIRRTQIISFEDPSISGG